MSARSAAILFVLMLLLVPATSAALQLRWGNGADTLSFASATRCVLILRSDSTEALPYEWRLAWLADSMGVSFAATDSLTACQADSATVASLDPPVTHADSLAHLLTARFCSESGPASLVAYYLLNQSGGCRGRFKVVALDPNDPNAESVIQSNEVTCNGGVEGDYAPLLLRAESSHETAELRVRVVGAWLDSVAAMKVGAPDDLWSVPLSIISRDSASIEAVADVEVLLPEAVVQGGTPWGASDIAWLASEQLATAAVMSGSADTVMFCDPQVGQGWYPKDFAFLYQTAFDPTDIVKPWKGYFHLFYIRAKHGDAASDSALAHAWSQDLVNWEINLHAFAPRHNGGWEDRKVWAPNIHQVGSLYHTFYTGVDALGNQSIGHATAPSLWTPAEQWTRYDTPVYTASQTDWADEVGHENAGRTSFRDPFVMPDPSPEFPTRYLLFNAGEDRNLFPRYTIGVARNEAGTLREWRNIGNYEATDDNHLDVTGALESPLVVRDSLTGAWRMFVANADYDNLGHFSTAFLTQNVGDSLTDTRATSWPQQDWLYEYFGEDADFIGWQACEHLQIGEQRFSDGSSRQIHYFAAYQGDGIGITRLHWNPELGKFDRSCPELTSVSGGSGSEAISFSLSSLPRGDGTARFILELHDVASPRLVVYDVMGRRVRMLSNGRPLQGRVELDWDGRGDSGQKVASGIYFARLSGAGRARVVRVPMVR